MDYKCGVCNEIVHGDFKVFIDHTEGHIVDIISQKHPEWVQKNGLCRKCLDYYRKEMKGA